MIWNALTNGSGGLDWAGLALMVELFDVADVEALIERLLVIKSHKTEA